MTEFGARIRAQRKALGINATTTAEAAGMSRVTLHRIENGEPSVTIGAYMNVVAALGLDMDVVSPGAAVAKASQAHAEGWIPARIRLDDYPQLKSLAWQVHGTDTLTPLEAIDIYERNWRHVDVAALSVDEARLVDALRTAFK